MSDNNRFSDAARNFLHMKREYEDSLKEYVASGPPLQSAKAEGLVQEFVSWLVGPTAEGQARLSWESIEVTENTAVIVIELDGDSPQGGAKLRYVLTRGSADGMHLSVAP